MPFAARVLHVAPALVDLVQCEGVGAERDGGAGADLRHHHADAFLRVVHHFAVRTVDLQRARLAAGEACELLLVVQIVHLHLHAVEDAAVERKETPAQLLQKRGHDVLCRRCYAAADDDEPVDKGYGRSHGVACDLSHHGKRAACGVTVSRALAFGDVEYVLRLERGVGYARELRVDSLHGTYGHTLLDHHVGHVLVFEAEGLHTRVVSHVEFAVADESESESRAEGVSQQVAVAFAAAGLGQTVVYLGQGSREGLAVGIQVGIVIYIYGYSESVVQEGAEGNAVTERGEVGQMTADDTVGVVGGAREGEAYGYGRAVERGDHAIEPLYHRGQTAVEVCGIRGERYRLDNKPVGAHGAEYEIGASGIERDDGAVIVSVHYCVVLD